MLCKCRIRPTTPVYHAHLVRRQPLDGYWDAPYCYTLLPTHEAFDARQITLSPNPARDRLKVVSAANVPIREIRLLSLAGQELALRPVDGVSCELPVAGLPAGVYYLLLTMNDGSQCHKRFVKS